MVVKNSMGIISIPTEYPYMVGYYKLTTLDTFNDAYNNFMTYDLS